MSDFDADLHELFENAPCGYLVTRVDGLVTRVNATFLGWTGYQRDDLVGRRRFQDLLSVGGRIFHETHLAPLQSMQGFLREVALEINRSDGTPFAVIMNSVVDRRKAGHDQVRLVVIDATERHRFEEELRRAQRRLERLQRITTAFASAATSDEVVRVALDDVLDGIKADHGWLAMRDGDGWRMLGRQRATADSDTALMAEWAVMAEPAKVLSTGRAAFVEERDRSRPRLASASGLQPGCRRLAILPLQQEGHPAGVLCIGSMASPAFTSEERTFLSAFADLTAQALDRARLHDDARVTAERSVFVAGLTQALDETTSFRERAQRLVDTLVPAVADYATVEIPALGPEPVAVQHRDRALVDTLRQLRTMSAVPADVPHSLAAARETHQPQLLTDIDESMYGAYGLDMLRLDMLRRLAPRSYVGLPLLDRGRLVGTLMLVTADSGRRFQPTQLGFLTDLASRAATALENARLYEHERSVSRELQRQLLPQSLPRDPRVDLSTYYRAGPALADVGGDWYDAFPVGPNRLGLMVGDVVGRGIAAASTMGQVRTALRAYAFEGHGVSHTLGRMDQFAASIDRARGATVVYAELELDTGVLHYACAGHPPPILIPASGRAAAQWGGRSAPLGVGATARHQSDTVLDHGSRLILYTDGLVERRQLPVDQGITALIDHIDSDIGRTQATDLEALAREFLPEQHHGDDVCILSIARV